MLLTLKLKHGVNEPIKHGDWIDLHTAESVTLKAGEYKEIDLGIVMQVPPNCHVMILPRSSIFKRYGILMANSAGIIDHDYCGDDDYICFPAYATRDITIEKNTRIAQFRVFLNQLPVSFYFKDQLNTVNRGGLGSTGK